MKVMQKVRYLLKRRKYKMVLLLPIILMLVQYSSYPAFLVHKGYAADDSLTISSDYTLVDDVEVSSLTIEDGTLDLNGHTLTVDSDFTQTGGTVDLGGGILNITGDLNQSDGELSINKGKINLNGSYTQSGDGNLQMENADDYFNVGKDFTISSYGYDNNLQAGTIEVKGDFTQKGSYTSNFAPEGTHKVILSGADKQTISFDSPTYSYFNILQVTKPLLTGYNFATKVNWNKLIQVTQSVSVTGVSLSHSNLNFKVGDAPVTLSPTLTPSNATNKKVSWSSSNSQIAKVDANGVVTPLAVGTATITATTNDGNKTAKCVVTVNPETIAVTGVKLNSNSLSLNINDAPVKYQSTVSPANASNKNVSWTSSDSTVASVDDNGTVTPVGAGSAVITVQQKMVIKQLSAL
jgi:uncharacterized protein YjdB